MLSVVSFISLFVNVKLTKSDSSLVNSLVTKTYTHFLLIQPKPGGRECSLQFTHLSFIDMHFWS